MTNAMTAMPDRDARFERDVAPEGAWLFAAAMRLTHGNACDSDELVSETMERAYTRLHQLREGCSVRGWLRTILQNASVDRFRKLGREVLPGEMPMLPVARSAEAEAMDRMPDSDLARALRRLPADQRRAVVLSDVEGYTNQEIGDMTGTLPATVKSRVFRARASMRGYLAKHEAPAA
jgi:RNA polymerase sigma-70 factor (ECF subfamily)